MLCGAPMTNTERLAVLGQALYGERWQRPVARDLGKAENQVRRWLTSEYEPDDDVVAALLAVARQRRKALLEAIRATR